ncbi:short-subunit dehydrogenase involved in D-alanine esterification of teichoic acids [Peribacillus simplex]|nr:MULTISPECIES: SDR family NAD(P)-dependent oxidoreductase [Peribacillus]MDF9758325.1 short-subunit dehydrogenase involved in D-alanine esterification of teichoic acids [Peribacillus simplex]MDQ0884786.1 short-subunit dehydrogenase involved in D-alanine esterification of teichoic acids [Peribacillus sp. V2I11]
MSLVARSKTLTKQSKKTLILIGIAADVSQVKSVDQLTHQIKQQYPKLDLLFNSAGMPIIR